MDKSEEEKEEELKRALGMVAMNMVVWPTGLGIAMFVVSMYYLYHDQLYVIGWVVVGVTLPLTLGMYFLGRWLGGQIISRKKDKRWPYHRLATAPRKPTSRDNAAPSTRSTARENVPRNSKPGSRS